MTTQVQIRGTSQATQEARVLVSRELDINTTDWRLCVHNGSTGGGIKHVNCHDQQNSEFNYASVSGTNALTASMRVAPIGYIEGAVYVIKIASTNTASVTLNLNSLGAKTLKKFTNGSLVDLDPSDLLSGMIIQVLYDGTYFQVVGGLGGGGTNKISWIPAITVTGGGVSVNTFSYTATDCIYVDLGYAVSVSFGISVSLTGTGVFEINNLPFNSETASAVRVKKGTTYIDTYITASDNLLKDFSANGVSADYNGVFTYIKD